MSNFHDKNYLSEESPTATTFAAVEVDMNIVILAIDRFLNKRFLQKFAVHGKSIFINHLEARNRRVLIEIHTQLTLTRNS